MRIGIDYWPATTHAPGVGRYVRELVRALVRRDDAPWLGLFDVGPGARTIPAEALGLPAQPGGGLRRLQLALPRRALALVPLPADRLLGGCDLFQRAFLDRPRIGRARQAFTLTEIPKPGDPRHAAVRRAAAQLDGVLVSGAAARAAACERLGLDPDRVHPVPVGCEHWMRALGGAPRPAPDGPPHRIVALGRVDRARRPLDLIEATAALVAGGLELELVFAGRPGDCADEVRAALAEARFPARWIEAPREEELPRLVGGAAVLAQLEPEAFTAVTPLEALAAGAAVVATRTPVFEETLGAEVEWVPPEDASHGLLEAALATALRSATDPAARGRRAALAGRYTWDRAAALTAEAWERILGRV